MSYQSGEARRSIECFSASLIIVKKLLTDNSELDNQDEGESSPTVSPSKDQEQQEDNDSSQTPTTDQHSPLPASSDDESSSSDYRISSSSMVHSLVPLVLKNADGSSNRPGELTPSSGDGSFIFSKAIVLQQQPSFLSDGVQNMDEEEEDLYLQIISGCIIFNLSVLHHIHGLKLLSEVDTEVANSCLQKAEHLYAMLSRFFPPGTSTTQNAFYGESQEMEGNNFYGHLISLFKLMAAHNQVVLELNRNDMSGAQSTAEHAQSLLESVLLLDQRNDQRHDFASMEVLYQLLTPSEWQSCLWNLQRANPHMCAPAA